MRSALTPDDHFVPAFARSVNRLLSALHMRITVSIKVMKMVWDAEFPNIASKTVALKLADCASDDGREHLPFCRNDGARD